MGVNLLKGNIQKWNLKNKLQKKPGADPGFTKTQKLGIVIPPQLLLVQRLSSHFLRQSGNRPP